jgi:RimJ/RimL family protein N-acetyltransferase
VSFSRFTMLDINHRHLGRTNYTKVARFSNRCFTGCNGTVSRAYLHRFPNSPNLFLLIFNLGSGEALGTAIASASSPRSMVHVGILLVESDRWGQGLGTETWCLLVEWVIGEVGLRKSTADCATSNHDMIRWAEAAGIRPKTIKRPHETFDGGPQDLV